MNCDVLAIPLSAFVACERTAAPEVTSTQYNVLLNRKYESVYNDFQVIQNAFRTCGLIMFLISNFRRVLNVVCFLLGNSPASEFFMPTFRNTQSRLAPTLSPSFLMAQAIFEPNLFAV